MSRTTDLFYKEVKKVDVIYGIMGMGGIQGGQPVPMQAVAAFLAAWLLLFLKNIAYSKP